MNENLTKNEESYIKRLRRVLRDWPEDLVAYVIDGGHITICKKFVKSDNFSTQINIPINAGAMLTDLHDDDPYNEVN